jgi:hypothetical protein
MDRPLTTDTLIEYHFGTLGPQARAEVEDTLLASADSLRLYLQLKRELDRAQPLPEAPSAQARLRLRTAVAELVRPEPQRGPHRAHHRPGSMRGLRGLLARPVPLYQTLAAAAVAALLVVMAGGMWPQPAADSGRSGSSEAAASAPQVDMARPHPLGLNVF